MNNLVDNWALFVEAVHISLQPTIVSAQLVHRECLVKKFIIYTKYYYTKAAIIYNVHQLLHWMELLHDWGPSWAHTAYPFETAHGKLLRIIKAANGIHNQICQHLSMRQCESILMNRIFPRIF